MILNFGIFWNFILQKLNNRKIIILPFNLWEIKFAEENWKDLNRIGGAG